MDDGQLKAAHAVIMKYPIQSISPGSPLGIQIEDQLWTHIDHSLEQTNGGIGRDADEVIDDLMREYAI